MSASVSRVGSGVSPSSAMFRDDSALACDSMQPSQFHHAGDVRCSEGERQLMAAVLVDAIHCYLKGARGNEKRLEYLEVKEWLESSGGSGLFAFENLSQALGFDPQSLRRKIQLPGSAEATPRAVVHRRVRQAADVVGRTFQSREGSRRGAMARPGASSK